MSCGCSGTTTPQPCCNNCADTNPCESGCLDIIDAGCIEYTTSEDGPLITSETKLDDVIKTLEQAIQNAQTSGDKFVRISSVDPTSGYLFDKVTTCDKITTTIVTSGGQQKLRLCIDTDAWISAHDENAIFFDTDGLNINYTTLIDTIINTPELMTALCAAIAGC